MTVVLDQTWMKNWKDININDTWAERQQSGTNPTPHRKAPQAQRRAILFCNKYLLFVFVAKGARNLNQSTKAQPSVTIFVDRLG